MTRCDLCAERVDPDDVVELFTRLRVHSVREVCPRCADKIGVCLADQRTVLEVELYNRVRRYVLQLKRGDAPPPARGLRAWFRKLFARPVLIGARVNRPPMQEREDPQ